MNNEIALKGHQIEQRETDTSTLSDKIWETTQHKYIPINDIKDFIKRLFKVVDNEIGLETTKGRRIVNGFNRELGDKLTK